MDWANPALWVAVGGVVTAVGAVIAQIRHANGPSHQAPPGGQQ